MKTNESKTTIISSAQSHHQLRKLTYTGIFAAMITLMTAYICHVPVGSNGGYIHFGDSLIYLGAVLLPTPYALAAAAIGGGLADLLTAPAWTIATIIIKMLITIPFSNKTSKIICPRNVIATVIAFAISGTGYFIAEVIMFGMGDAAIVAAFLSSMSGSLIQSGGSAIFFLIFGLFLDKMGFKKRFLN